MARAQDRKDKTEANLKRMDAMRARIKMLDLDSAYTINNALAELEAWLDEFGRIAKEENDTKA